MDEINNAPVLLMTFNRPAYTQKVFDKIRDAKVKKLYFFNDGPRDDHQNDHAARRELRNLLDSIDWECDVHTNFQEKNLGAGWGPSAAITWAFQNEERLIVLEDDCVPSLPFFGFCNHCLEKYKDDTRIWIVSGRSHQQDSRFFKNQDYIFTHYGHTNGWATWKRCWNHFDIDMKKWPAFYQNGGFSNVFYSKKEVKFYNQYYLKLNRLAINSWDARFGFAVLSNGGLSIVSAKNLIQNVGIIGLHSNAKSFVHRLQAASDYTFSREPMFIMVNHEYEIYHFRRHILRAMGAQPFYKRLIRKLFQVLRLK